MNILNKRGFLTEEDRKESLSYGCNYLRFSSCLDLSDGVNVTAYSSSGFVTPEQYSQDLASFMVWWTENVFKDLNGFSGFSHVKFNFINFSLCNPQ